MTPKRDKEIQKLWDSPKNVTFEELRKVMEREGFVVEQPKGDDYTFRHPNVPEILTVPSKRKQVLPVYVAKARKLIRKARGEE